MEAAHADLERATRALRVAVLARDPAAAAWHATLTGGLLAHMNHEETWIFPLFVGPYPANATPEILNADHARIRALLIATEAAAGDPVSAIARCDRLSQLEGALEHHDRREVRHVVPRLPPTAPVPELVRLPDFAPAAATAADWGSPVVDDPVEALVFLLAGAAPWSAIRPVVAQLAARPALPKAHRLATRAAEAASAEDRVATWDALRLLRAIPRNGAGGGGDVLIG